MGVQRAACAGELGVQLAAGGGQLGLHRAEVELGMQRSNLGRGRAGRRQQRAAAGGRRRRGGERRGQKEPGVASAARLPAGLCPRGWLRSPAPRSRPRRDPAAVRRAPKPRWGRGGGARGCAWPRSAGNGRWERAALGDHRLVLLSFFVPTGPGSRTGRCDVSQD